MDHQLRPYQTRAFLSISETFRREKKILLVMPTGSGKTVIFCQILKRVFAKNKKAIMVVHGRKLVKQAVDRLIRENVPHSVCMAGEKNYNPNENIQVCSIDTIFSRKLILPADLIVIDEAHLATSKSYEWLIETHPDAFILGVTATPYCEKSLRHIANTIIKPVSISELIHQGYLVGPRYFSIKEPDLTGVSRIKTQMGTDYNKNEVDSIMNQKFITNDIVQKWIKYGENRQTICFACSVEHSKNLTSEFVNFGINAQHIDASTPDFLREYYFEKFQNKQIQILVNCNILSLGVDLPACDCILMARPTDSLALYIQQAGRGTRISNGKKDFIILDCAGNILRHGFITAEHQINLDGKIVSPELKIKRCPECYYVYQNEKICPNCGYQNDKNEKKRNIEQIDSELIEIYEMNNFNRQLMQIQKQHGYKKAWCYHKIKEKYGVEQAKKYYPQYHAFYNLKK